MFLKNGPARALSLALVAGTLGGCVTTSTPPTETAPQTRTQPAPTPTFSTRGERAMYNLGQCVQTRGQSNCQSQIATACSAIAANAFRNSESSRQVRIAYQEADSATRREWETKTANLAMRRVGLGSPC
jgi:hypothetical protein